MLCFLSFFRSHYNVRELGSLIYDTVFSLRTPGSKELLLHQNVPASYLALEDVVANIGTYLKHVGSDPVLNFENFKQMVYQEMHFQNFKSFRLVDFKSSMWFNLLTKSLLLVIRPNYNKLCYSCMRMVCCFITTTQHFETFTSSIHSGYVICSLRL